MVIDKHFQELVYNYIKIKLLIAFRSINDLEKEYIEMASLCPIMIKEEDLGDFFDILENIINDLNLSKIIMFKDSEIEAFSSIGEDAFSIIKSLKSLNGKIYLKKKMPNHILNIELNNISMKFYGTTTYNEYKDILFRLIGAQYKKTKSKTITIQDNKKLLISREINLLLTMIALENKKYLTINKIDFNLYGDFYNIDVSEELLLIINNSLYIDDIGNIYNKGKIIGIVPNTTMQYQLIKYLIDNKGVFKTCDEIFNDVYGKKKTSKSKEGYIRDIKSKLPDEIKRIIKTKKGGYLI